MILSFDEFVIINENAKLGAGIGAGIGAVAGASHGAASGGLAGHALKQMKH